MAAGRSWSEAPVPHYLSLSNGSGHLLYVNNATLFAVPFDLATLETRGTAVPAPPLTVTTHWFTTSSPEPVKIFLHLTDEAGNIVAQWDGLGAKWQGWRPQSLLRHTHAIPLPADLPPGRYEVRLGLYNPENGRRLPTTAGQDSIVLGDVLIESAP